MQVCLQATHVAKANAMKLKFSPVKVCHRAINILAIKLTSVDVVRFCMDGAFINIIDRKTTLTGTGEFKTRHFHFF